MIIKIFISIFCLYYLHWITRRLFSVRHPSGAGCSKCLTFCTCEIWEIWHFCVKESNTTTNFVVKRCKYKYWIAFVGVHGPYELHRKEKQIECTGEHRQNAIQCLNKIHEKANNRPFAKLSSISLCYDSNTAQFMTDYCNFQFNGNLELDNTSYNYCLPPMSCYDLESLRSSRCFLQNWLGTCVCCIQYCNPLTSQSDYIGLGVGVYNTRHDKNISVCWLVVLRINVDLAIFQPYLDLEAGDNQSLKIQVARPGIEPRSSCSASQELHHSATAAPYFGM